MTASHRVYPDRWQRRTARQALVQWLWLLGWAFAAVWSVSALDIEWAFLADAHVQAADLLARMWPPRWAYLPLSSGHHRDRHPRDLGTMIAVVLSRGVIPRARSHDRHSHRDDRPGIRSSRARSTVLWGLLFVATFRPGAWPRVACPRARRASSRTVAHHRGSVSARSKRCGPPRRPLQTGGWRSFPVMRGVVGTPSIADIKCGNRASSAVRRWRHRCSLPSINQFAWTQVRVVLFPSS